MGLTGHGEMSHLTTLVLSTPEGGMGHNEVLNVG